MSTLKNQVQLIGNLGNDPEIKTLENGQKMATFQMAVNESYKNEKGEKITNTSWFPIVSWNKTADLVQRLLVKGSEVAISGKLNTRSYEDKDGNQKFITQVVLSEFLLLSGGSPKQQ